MSALNRALSQKRQKTTPTKNLIVRCGASLLDCRPPLFTFFFVPDSFVNLDVFAPDSLTVGAAEESRPPFFAPILITTETATEAPVSTYTGTNRAVQRERVRQSASSKLVKYEMLWLAVGRCDVCMELVRPAVVITTYRWASRLHVILLETTTNAQW